MIRRSRVIAAAALLLVAACGPRPASTSGSGPASPAAVHLITAADGGHVVSVQRGDLVETVLPGTGEAFHGFTTPVSGDEAVLEPNGLACAAPAGQHCTEFRAVAAGKSVLTAVEQPACLNAHPRCALPERAWTVTVSVA